MFHRDRTGRHGGGILIYTAKEFKGHSLVVTPHTDMQIDPLESLCLHIKLHHLKFTICTVYRPPSPPHRITDVDTALQQTLRVANNMDGLTIILGDFNFPSLQWPQPSTDHVPLAAREFLEVFEDTCLTQLVTDTTRSRIGQRSATLDLIMTNDESALSTPITRSPIGNSDHVVLNTDIQIVLQDETRHPPPENRKSYWRTNFEEVKRELGQLENATEHQNTEELENKWSALKIKMINVLDKHTPTKIRPPNPNKPWITNKIIKLAHKKKRLWCKYKSTNRQSIRKQFTELRNNLTNEIRTRRRNYEQNIAKTKGKQLYSYIRKQISTKVSVPHTLKREDGEITTDTREIAEIFATTFQNHYTTEPNGPIPPLSTPPSEDTLENIDFQVDHIHKILTFFKSKLFGRS